MAYPRVLMLEDDPLTLLMFTIELQAEGFEVTGAGAPEEALQALRLDPKGFAAIVVDLDLRQGGDGYIAARAMREINPTLPLIYTSGEARRDFAVERVAGGELVAKPCLPQELSRLLRRLLDPPPA